jgi:hypothetical protein
MANGNQGVAFSKVTRADLSPSYKGYACVQSFFAFGEFDHLLAAAGIFSGAFLGLMAALLKPLKRAAENHRRTASSISQWRSLHMTKETQKALVIIIAALGVLVILLFWANHLRPHP